MCGDYARLLTVEQIETEVALKGAVSCVWGKADRMNSFMANCQLPAVVLSRKYQSGGLAPALHLS